MIRSEDAFDGRGHLFVLLGEGWIKLLVDSG